MEPPLTNRGSQWLYTSIVTVDQSVNFWPLVKLYQIPGGFTFFIVFASSSRIGATMSDCPRWRVQVGVAPKKWVLKGPSLVPTSHQLFRRVQIEASHVSTSHRHAAQTSNKSHWNRAPQVAVVGRVVAAPGPRLTLIFVYENAYDSIVCKLEFDEISNLLNSSQYSNAYDEMILIFEGTWISTMSRLANKRISNSSLFSSLLPIKYLSSLNMKWLLNDEILIYFQIYCFITPPFFQFKGVVRFQYLVIYIVLKSYINKDVSKKIFFSEKSGFFRKKSFFQKKKIICKIFIFLKFIKCENTFKILFF